MSKLSCAIIAILFPFYCFSSCGIGTLSCSKSSGSAKPLVCDFFNSYVMDSKTLSCVKKTIPNCIIPSVPNNSRPCYLCANGYTIDSENLKCVEVPAESQKENCEQYSNTSMSCLKCQSGFYVSAGACLSLDGKEIPNCQVYASKTECQMCAPGTFLQEGKCLVFSSLQNCYIHRNIKCDQCKDQYFHNTSANPPLNESNFSFSNFDFGSFVSRNPNYAYWTEEFGAQICQQGNIKNCKIYESFSICTECEEGYYRNSSMKCDRFQEEPIPGCDLYSSATICSKCQFQHFLQSSGASCVKAKTVDSCKEYHETLDKCVRCDDNLYLSPSGECDSTRDLSASISNCKQTFASKDQCEICKEGFKLSSQNTACYEDIPNCQSLIVSNGSNEYHTCSFCNEGFHPNDEKNKCEETIISQCKKVVSQKNQCEICNDGYYFDSTKVECVAQSRDKCLEYLSMSNNCTKCEVGYYAQSGSCYPISLKDLCFESNGTSNACEKCLPKYVKAGTTCNNSLIRNETVIDSQCQSNTETEKNSKCSDCGDSHFILEGTLRAYSDAYLTGINCAKVNPDTGACLQCMENSSGNGSTCLAPDPQSTTDCIQLKEGYFGTLDKNNCAKCRDHANNYVDPVTHSCVPRTNISANDKCEILPEGNGDCQICKDNGFPLRDSQLRDKCEMTSNISGYASILGCTIYNAEDNTCFLCDIGKIASSNGKTCVTDVDSLILNFDKELNLINQNQFEKIDNCDSYHQLDLEVIKCSRCKTGFVNIVKITQTDDSPLLYDYFSLGKNVGLGGFSLPVEKCEPYLDSYQDNKGVPAITSDHCEIGIQEEGKPGYACLRCRKDRNGSVSLLEKDKDGNALGTSIKGVSVCSSETTMTATYSGIGYNLRYMKNYIPYIVYMHFTAVSYTHLTLPTICSV